MNPSFNRRSIASIALGSALVALVILLAVGSWSLATFGNLRDGVTSMGGSLLRLRQPRVSLGKIVATEPVDIAIEVTNLSSQPIPIVGAETGCSCAVVSGLPMEIPPRQTAAFTVQFMATENDAGSVIERPIRVIPGGGAAELWAMVIAEVVPNHGIKIPQTRE